MFGKRKNKRDQYIPEIQKAVTILRNRSSLTMCEGKRKWITVSSVHTDRTSGPYCQYQHKPGVEDSKYSMSLEQGQASRNPESVPGEKSPRKNDNMVYGNRWLLRCAIPLAMDQGKVESSIDGILNCLIK